MCVYLYIIYIYIFMIFKTYLFTVCNKSVSHMESKETLVFCWMTTSQLKDYLPQSSSRHILSNGFVRLDYCTEVGIEELANEGAQL